MGQSLIDGLTKNERGALLCPEARDPEWDKLMAFLEPMSGQKGMCKLSARQDSASSRMERELGVPSFPPSLPGTADKSSGLP